MTAFPFALALTKSGDARGETACGVVDAVDARPVTAGSHPEYASSWSRVRDGITEHTGDGSSPALHTDAGRPISGDWQSWSPIRRWPCQRTALLTARPSVPLFKQKIIAKFLEIQDELRRLKKRYAKAGVPLILMKK